jgi:hypothetical protein
MSNNLGSVLKNTIEDALILTLIGVSVIVKALFMALEVLFVSISIAVHNILLSHS